MKYTTAPGFRRNVLPMGAAFAGSGCSIPDGRVVYTYNDFSGNIRRAWLANEQTLNTNYPDLEDDEAIIASAQGTASVHYVDGRLLLFVHHKPSVTDVPTVATAFAPALGAGVSCLESFDDGVTWELLGTSSAGSQGNSSLGFYQDPGAMLSVDGILIIPACFSGSFLGDPTPNPGVYRSTDGGSSWSMVLTSDPGFFTDAYSRNVAIDENGVLWWGNRGGGFGIPYLHLWRSDDTGATWSEVTTDPAASSVSTLAYDRGHAWAYDGSGQIYTAEPDHAGEWTFIFDKVTPPPFGEWPIDFGAPMLVELSRSTVAFGRQALDVVSASTGWRVGVIGFAGGPTVPPPE